jgi:uncharacterized protein (DUF305 family)
MRITWGLSLALLLLPAIALAAWRQDSHPHSQMAATAWSDQMKNMDTMQVAMASVQSSNDSDADFVNLMLPHHQAAIDMARTQLLYGKDPQMRRLAQEIVADQESEIQLMQRWLDAREPNAHSASDSADRNALLLAQKAIKHEQQ